MRNLRPTLLAPVLTATTPGLLHAQKSGPASAKAGPSLDVTMRFIQDTLSEIGTVNFVTFFQKTSDGSTGQTTFVYQYSNVRVDARACDLSYHVKATRDGASGEGDSHTRLADAQDVVVEPFAQYISAGTASQGHPELITTSTNPTLTVLRMRYRPKSLHFDSFFLFTDADLADRAAKAMSHAIELCGGGSKDPF
jgi:hypothetical protein